MLLTLLFLGCCTTAVVNGQGSNSAPYFDSNDAPFFARISEGAVIGDFVVTVTAEDVEGDPITYNIPSGTIGSDKFEINGTGVVTVKQELDREAVNSYMITIEARDQVVRQSYGTWNVIIRLTDVNDEAPEFVSGRTSLNLTENTIDQNLETYRAEDEDQGLNAVVRYDIFEAGVPFSIDPINGQLRVVGAVDYDGGDQSYSITLRAIDSGDVPLTGLAQVTITILDADDEPPAFDLSAYMAEVSENATEGSMIQRVSAVDQDTGINSPIEYAISEVRDGTNSIVSSDLFFVNNETGQVFTNSSLDYEESQSYAIIITATEVSVRRASATATVSLTVEDLNDNSPVFEDQEYSIDIDETSAGNSRVLQVIATDQDGNDHDDFEYEIITPNATNFFRVESNGEIFLTNPLDFESQQMHTFQVRALETVGARTLNGTTTVRVAVVNMNDEAPVFVNPQDYSTSINENAPENTTVFYVSSTDRDVPPFNSRMYSVVANSSSSSGLFAVDPVSGRVYVLTADPQDLDFDSDPNTFTVEVEVSDGASSNTAVVSISLDPLNDNRPIIEPVSSLSIVEGLPVQGAAPAPVGSVTASDADRNPQHNTLLWCIVAGNDDGFFDLTNFNGSDTTNIVAVSALDYENERNYTLTLRVTDGPECEGNITNTSTAVTHSSVVFVPITVLDSNDNPPMFENLTYLFVINEEEGGSSYVGTVSASDMDSSAIITYELDATGNEMFTINSSSGVITTRANIDREMLGGSSPAIDVSFTVQANDMHLSSSINQTVSADIVVSISDINDHDPVFQAIATVEILENSPSGTGYAFSATDADAGTNAEITYEILLGNENGTFQLSNIGGVATLSYPALDRENVSSYQIVVEARDGGNRSSNVTIAIAVLDENDETPMFVPAMLTAHVLESAPPATQVLDVNATDPDEGVNSELSFYFMDSNGDMASSVSPFVINRVTGVITTMDLLDRESQERYDRTVYVRDGGLTAKSAMAQLTICVTDVNDNSPRFTGDNIVQLRIPESFEVGGVLHTSTAEDSDDILTNSTCPEVELNYLIRYSLIYTTGNDFSNLFSVNPMTGSVTLLEELDYESGDINYFFSIRAADRNGSAEALVTTNPVSLVVTPVNDNAPNLTMSSYAVTIPEGTQTGVSIPLLTAADLDQGRMDGVIRYNGTYRNLVSISPGDGNIQVVGPLDFESDPEPFSFTAYAYDRGTPTSLWDSATVTVTISDVNDKTPAFQDTPYAVTFEEGDYSLMVLTTDLKVFANDSDGPMNNVVSYSLEDTLAGRFLVNASTGRLSASGGFDAEDPSQRQYTLTVIATDSGTPALSAETTISVSVSDKNDERPVLAAMSYSARIPENSTTPLLLLTVEASDADSDKDTNGRIGFELLAPTPFTNAFAVNASTGEVSYTGLVVFDRENPPSSDEFQVRVFDFGTNPSELDATATVTIMIDDINDNAPIFDPSDYSTGVPEDKPVGSELFTIQATDLDEMLNGNVTYQLLNNYGFFAVDRFTGAVSLEAELDYETQNRSYSLVFEARDRGATVLNSTATAVITVTNTIDTDPVFLSAPYAASIPENAVPEQLVQTVRVQDLDDGDQVTFELQGTHANLFSIGSTGSRVATSTFETNVTVAIGASFDYEVDPITYSLVVVATDSNSLTATSSVRVDLSDYNDETPLFTQPGYLVEITAGRPTNTLVVSVNAQDGDRSSDNSQVSYAFAPNTTTEVEDQFQLDESTGDIRTQSALTYSPGLKYTFWVVANDSVTPPLSSAVKVEVIVNDNNIDAPVFTKDLYNASIVEGEISGSFVLEVSAIDPENGTVKYFILGNNNFRFDNNQSRLFTNAILDYEAQSQYTFSIRAQDTGAVPRFGYAQVMVNVLDKNDNDPMFVGEPFAFSITENPSPGAIVGTVSASDEDSGINAQLVYSPVPSPHFTISSDGVIRVSQTAVLDREDQAVHTFTVNVRDNGVTVNTATPTIVTIMLIDAIDVTPKFTETVYTASILEGSEQENQVTQVTVVDPDLDDSHTFGIISGDDNDKKFQIDGNGRILTTAIRLDRETKADYLLIVTATDKAGLTGTSMVTVTVLDRNDNAPVFAIGSTITRFVQESSTKHFIETFLATDDDMGTNGEVVYSVTNDDSGVFSFEDNQLFATNLDREDPRYQRGDYAIYNIEITATDRSADDAMSTSVQATFNVSDANDNPPLFTLDAYSVSISESSPLTSPVVSVTAVDQDVGPNAQVVYDLQGSNLFTVDQTGNVTVARPLPDGVSFYMVTLVATDEGSPPASSMVTLNISLLDERDNAPRFSQSIYGPTVLENLPGSTVVENIGATDPDPGDTITYTLVDNFNAFAIASNGSLFTLNSLDREEISSYTIYVVATDMANQASTATVQVTVLDENDEEPEFDQQSYSASVPENSRGGVLVAEVRAVDEDEGNNGLVLYSLSGDGSSNFAITPTTGIITVSNVASLNREDDSKYVITVLAADMGAQQMTSSASITIDITDENDNPPMFTQATYSFSLNEDFYTNETVPSNKFVMARDADGDNNLTYAIVSGDDGMFDVDPTTGEILVIGSLDRERKELYDLSVTATDSGPVVFLLGSATVMLRINDVNDNKPVFSEVVYRGRITEVMTPQSQFVVRVTANDIDSGNNAAVEYSLLNGTSLFQISESSGNIFTRIAAFDREVQSSYVIGVMAIDMGDSRMSSTVTVVVTVEDINDGQPYFEPIAHTVDLRLPVSASTMVSRLVAYDDDEGSNSEIDYRVLSNPYDLVLNDSVAGLVVANSELDDPNLVNTTYQLTVLAVDRGSPRLTGSVVVTINFLAGNDPRPIFSQSLYQVSLQENNVNDAEDGFGIVTSSFAVVVNFEGLSPSNLRVSSRSVPGGISMLDIDQSGSAFDREVRGFYSLTLVATPSQGGISSYATVYLTIEDANDNAPMFTNEPFSAEVVEMALLESPIGVTVMASDLDADAFGAVTFSFAQNENDTFKVNPLSGEITVNNNIDREINPSFELLVVASDGGGQSSTAAVSVRVLDVNDNSPMFDGLFNRTIPESFSPGDMVVRVSADDLDDGINSRLTYSFINLGSAPFSIDSTTGVIRTIQALDFDQGTTYYDLSVLVRDGGASSLSNDTSFRITLTDVNDCVPTFTSPTYGFTMSEELTEASVIGQASATDCDSGDNKVITYTIANGNEEGKFKIVDSNIILNETIDFEVFKSFQLTIQATDNGADVQLSSQAEVTITILDDNDNTPEFTALALPLTVVEGSTSGTSVDIVSASDPDQGVNGTVNYRIEQHSTQGAFGINPTMGTIFINGDIDREEIDFYWLYVSAFDLGREPRTAFTNITIQITDINDNLPSFGGLFSCDNVMVDVEIQENSPLGTFVRLVSATDADIGANQNIQYSIIGGNTGEVFLISTEGNVTVLNSPDREAIPNGRLTLTIQASDAGTPQLSTLGCLNVEILDCNDFPPTFINPPTEVSIRECETIASLATFSASDADMAGTKNSEISFRFCPDEPSYSPFTIQPTVQDTASIIVVSELDRENISSYSLCVEAYNADSDSDCTSSGAINSTRTFITVVVLDKNDNAPMFSNAVCNATLSEIEMPSNQTVVMLSAYDDDAPGTSNAALKWIAPVEDNPFHINAATGIITLRRELNFEDSREYSLEYVVADAGPVKATGFGCSDIAMSSTITCTFSILDENDNAPVFDNAPYSASVCEEKETVGEFFTVSYSDEDEDPFRTSLLTITGWSPGQNIPDLFTVDSSSGRVRLNRALDRESSEEYTVFLQADNLEPGVCPDKTIKNCALTSNSTLTVRLIDVNDNPPVFATESLTAEVPSASNPPYNVKTIRTSDRDTGANAQVSFTLQEPAELPSGTFSINNATGEVTLTGSVQAFEGQSFFLTVIATDSSDSSNNCDAWPRNAATVNISVTVVGDLQKICLQFGCDRSTILKSQNTILRKIEQITNFTVTGPTFVTDPSISGTLNCFSMQNPVTNLLVKFDDLEDILFNNFNDLATLLTGCPVVSIKTPGRPEEPVTLPSITPLIPLFVLCGAVALGAFIILCLASNQRRAARRQRQKEYLGNIFFGTAPTDLESRGLIQMEQLQQGADEITHENPVFIEPFQRWENVDASREPSTHVAESAVTLTRGNPAYESQEIRMEMFQDGGDEDLLIDDSELLAEALKDESDEDDDFLVTAI